jgi:hypothetical protein
MRNSITVARNDDWIYKLDLEERFNKPLFYFEDGLVVFTPIHHIIRGTCCGNKCRHCPYEPLHIKGNSQLQDIYIKE